MTKRLEGFVARQVQRGRFRSNDEVVRAALREMEESEQQRELAAFERAFREIDQHSPVGEPTPEDLAEIARIVSSVRAARKHPAAAKEGLTGYLPKLS